MLRGAEQSMVEALLEPFPGRRGVALEERFAIFASLAARLAAARISRRAAALYGLVTLLATAVAAMVNGLACAILVPGAAAVVALLMIRRCVRRRLDEMERDLPALLTTIASSVRAGIDPVSAMVQARTFFQPSTEIARELAAFAARVAAGESDEGAISAFMHGLKSADLELFKRCMALSRRHGASLAEPLHRVVRVVRQRQSFRRKTRGALAMHRMSAVGIALCAGVMAGIQVVMNRGGVQLAWEHPVGWKLLATGGGLMACGICWMMSLGREEKL